MIVMRVNIPLVLLVGRIACHR